MAIYWNHMCWLCHHQLSDSISADLDRLVSMIIPNKLDTFRYGNMTNRHGNRYDLTIHVYNYIARLLYRYITILI